MPKGIINKFLGKSKKKDGSDMGLSNSPPSSQTNPLSSSSSSSSSSSAASEAPVHDAFSKEKLVSLMMIAKKSKDTSSELTQLKQDLALVDERIRTYSEPSSSSSSSPLTQNSSPSKVPRAPENSSSHKNEILFIESAPRKSSNADQRRDGLEASSLICSTTSSSSSSSSSSVSSPLSPLRDTTEAPTSPPVAQWVPVSLSEITKASPPREKKNEEEEATDKDKQKDKDNGEDKKETEEKVEEKEIVTVVEPLSSSTDSSSSASDSSPPSPPTERVALDSEVVANVPEQDENNDKTSVTSDVLVDSTLSPSPSDPAPSSDPSPSPPSTSSESSSESPLDSPVPSDPVSPPSPEELPIAPVPSSSSESESAPSSSSESAPSSSSSESSIPPSSESSDSPAPSSSESAGSSSSESESSIPPSSTSESSASSSSSSATDSPAPSVTTVEKTSRVAPASTWKVVKKPSLDSSRASAAISSSSSSSSGSQSTTSDAVTTSSLSNSQDGKEQKNSQTKPALPPKPSALTSSSEGTKESPVNTSSTPSSDGPSSPSSLRDSANTTNNDQGQTNNPPVSSKRRLLEVGRQDSSLDIRMILGHPDLNLEQLRALRARILSKIEAATLLRNSLDITVTAWQTGGTEDLDSTDVSVAPKIKLAPTVANTFSELPDWIASICKEARITEEMASAHWEVLLKCLQFNNKTKIVSSAGLEKWKESQIEENDTILDSKLLKIKYGRILKPVEEICKPFSKTAKNQFKFLEEEGAGGYGRVFFARWKKGNKKVAIKRMKFETDEDRANVVNELSFIQFCKGFRNVVEFHEAHIVGKEVWVIMDFLDGGSLHQAISSLDLTEYNIAFIVQQTLEALSQMHENGVVHRDIKSDNIMLTIYGEVVLIDFGLAVDFKSSPKNWNQAGSKFWMAPETIRRENENWSIDIWSIGVCILEMANGHPPNKGNPLGAMFQTATKGLLDVNFGLKDASKWSQHMKSFLSLCLQVDPANRPSAATLLKHSWIQLAVNDNSMEELSNVVSTSLSRKATELLSGGMF